MTQKVMGTLLASSRGRTGTTQDPYVLTLLEVTGDLPRVLTETECERLQGFPDGWTSEQRETDRKKQLGNAVAVPVVEWIISRIAQQ